MSTQEVINECYVEGKVIKLPSIQLEREEYELVKKRLTGIGGKWKGGRVNGFEFNYEPIDLLERLKRGEEINLKQQFQFFGTPDKLADWLVDLADLHHGLDILEPSAGQGAIVKAIRRDQESALVDCYELMPANQEVLRQVIGANVIGEDFIKVVSEPKYDRIIANPPFTNGQDIEHIYHMHKFLKPDGILVSMASPSWRFGSNKKQTAFREWLLELDAGIIDVPKGEFKESGTMVATCIIVIKPRLSLSNEYFEETRTHSYAVHDLLLFSWNDPKTSEKIDKEYARMRAKGEAYSPFVDFADECIAAYKKGTRSYEAVIHLVAMRSAEKEEFRQILIEDFANWEVENPLEETAVVETNPERKEVAPTPATPIRKAPQRAVQLQLF